MAEGGGQLKLSKFPWLSEGKSLTTSSSNMKAGVLCDAHNSALSPYDMLGGRFCTLLLKAGHLAQEGDTVAELFNGEDLECWFLKMLCGVTAMEALTRGVPWHAPKSWLDSLFKIRESMPSGAGLFFDLGGFWMFPGDAPSLSATPINTPDGGNHSGLVFYFCGMKFVFLLDLSRRSWYMSNGRFRPSLISISSSGHYNVRIGMRYTYSPPGQHLRATPVPSVP